MHGEVVVARLVFSRARGGRDRGGRFRRAERAFARSTRERERGENAHAHVDYCDIAGAVREARAFGDGGVGAGGRRPPAVGQLDAESTRRYSMPPQFPQYLRAGVNWSVNSTRGND